MNLYFMGGIALVGAAVVSTAWYKWDSAQEELQHRKETILQLEKNQAVLQGINQSNVETIDALQRDRELSQQAVRELTAQSAAVTKNLTSIRQKVASITTPPTQLSPRLVEAINGMQGQSP